MIHLPNTKPPNNSGSQLFRTVWFQCGTSSCFLYYFFDPFFFFFFYISCFFIFFFSLYIFYSYLYFFLFFFFIYFIYIIWDRINFSLSISSQPRFNVWPLSHNSNSPCRQQALSTCTISRSQPLQMPEVARFSNVSSAKPCYRKYTVQVEYRDTDYSYT